MVRGTTTRHVFILPYELADIAFDEVYVTYSQCGRTVLEKGTDDITRDGVMITADLSQDDTLRFSAVRASPSVQIRIRTEAGDALASNRRRFAVSDVLREGVI